MAYLDYSRLGGARSFADDISSLGDGLVNAIRVRNQRQEADAALALKQKHEAMQTADLAEQRRLKSDELSNQQLKFQDEKKHRDQADSVEAIKEIRGHIAAGDMASARAAAQARGLNVEDYNDLPAPGLPPQPQAPVPPDRPAEPPKDPRDAYVPEQVPPEVRAIRQRGAQAEAAVPIPEKAYDAYVPQQREPPAVATQPPGRPQGDAVDQEIEKSHAQELADYAKSLRDQTEAQVSLRGYNAQVQGARYGAEQKQGEAEQKYASDQAAFPAAQRSYQDAEKALPEQQRQYAEHAGLKTTLPNGEVATLTQQELRYAPRERDAADFQRNSIDPLQQQLSQAKTLPEIVRLRAQVAEAERVKQNILAGADKVGTAGETLRKQEQFGVKEANTDTRLDKTLANRTQNTLISASAARARADAAAAAGVDPKELNAYQGMVREVKTAALQKVDVAEARQASQLAQGLSQPNGPQLQLLMDGLVKGAVGGRAAVQLVQNAQKAIGAPLYYENKMYQQMHNGDFMPEVIDIYRKIARDQAQVHSANAANTAAAIEHKVGLSSAWANRPGMRQYIHDEMAATHAELGLPVPQQYSNEPAPAAALRSATAGAKHPLQSEIDDFLGQ